MISGADITFAPALAWPALAALGLAAGLTLGFALWRRAVGLWWRALGITALLLALANPTLISEDRQPLNDVVAVVVDHHALHWRDDRVRQHVLCDVGPADR